MINRESPLSKEKGNHTFPILSISVIVKGTAYLLPGPVLIQPFLFLAFMLRPVSFRARCHLVRITQSELHRTIRATCGDGSLGKECRYSESCAKEAEELKVRSQE